MLFKNYAFESNILVRTCVSCDQLNEKNNVYNFAEPYFGVTMA